MYPLCHVAQDDRSSSEINIPFLLIGIICREPFIILTLLILSSYISLCIFIKFEVSLNTNSYIYCLSHFPCNDGAHLHCGSFHMSCMT